MTRYKDNRFCTYVYAADDIWTQCGETVVMVTPEQDDQKEYHVKRKWLSEAPYDFGCSY